MPKARSRPGGAGAGTGTQGKSAEYTKSYTTHEFTRLVGVPQRRLRSWTSAGVLPPPEGRGRATRYSDTHVLLAKAIQQLRSRGMPLRDVPLQLAKLDRSELHALTRTAADPQSQQVGPPPAPSYPSVEWQAVNLVPGLVLLVNRNDNPVVERVADEIFRHYSAAGPRGGL